MIKVVLICYFSNSELRQILGQHIPWWEKMGRRIIGQSKPCLSDYCIWNTNAIRELEKYNELDIHLIVPQKFISYREVRFELRGIHYYIFRDEDSYLSSRIKLGLKLKEDRSYKKNRDYIKSVIKEVSPHLVHVIGAECPFYSLAILDVPKSIPTIIHLQTLINRPEFYSNYFMSKNSYSRISYVENKVLNSATYIATNAEKYIRIIHDNINPDAKILSLGLPLNEPLNYEKGNKTFDFVYFAKIIAKAIDYAIESFAIAYHQRPGISLDVIGSYTPEQKRVLDTRLKELGIYNAVNFEGELATHKEVIEQIRKARFALLPVKLSLVTGTIREAMANGLPVITSDTGELGTQMLNVERESVLISPLGDHQAMAENMIRLLDDELLVETLQKNAWETASKKKSNAMIVKKWYDSYCKIVDSFKNK